MNVKNVSDKFVVITCDNDMYCAIVEFKRSNEKWVVRPSYDGESHMFCNRSYFSKHIAMQMAKKFIIENAK